MYFTFIILKVKLTINKIISHRKKSLQYKVISHFFSNIIIHPYFAELYQNVPVNFVTYREISIKIHSHRYSCVIS